MIAKTSLVVVALLFAFTTTANAGVSGSQHSNGAAPPVLGKRGIYPGGSGFGTAHPRDVYLGGVPSGDISGINWHDWGKPTAGGSGRKPVYKPGGGYYAKRLPVQLRATRLGTCGSRSAYTRLLIRHRRYPGGPWTGWFPFPLNTCNGRAAPTPCHDTYQEGAQTGTEIAAWDTSCAVARKISTASFRRPFLPAGGIDIVPLASYQCHGTVGSDDTYEQYWSCIRGTAFVTFTRSAFPD